MSAREQSTLELDQLTRMRILMAGQIASGLVANPEQIALPNWSTETAIQSVRTADKIIALVISGGL